MRFLRVIVKGKVQGVFFRKFTKEKAIQLGIVGFVKNQVDGSVLIEAYGNNENIDQFISHCHKGPERSRVTELIIEEITPVEIGNKFDIRN